MKYFLVGLGNPGDEYENTRHNAGRRAVLHIKEQFDKLGVSKKLNFVTPDTMMNNSGKAVAPLVKSKKDLARLVVFYDDVDLPIGSFKISFNRGSGGHKGLESVTRAVKSKEFYRIRIGICPATPGGKLKKPDQKKLIDFILGDFKPNEEKELKKVLKKITEAMELFVQEGPSFAMNRFN